MTVLVVGAGIAGLACARELVDAGVPVQVVERDRVVGGRLASRRIDGRYADLGAAYLTADDPSFQGRLDSWRLDGLATPWTDTLVAFDGSGPRPAPGPMRWSAPGGLRSLAEDLARELDVTCEFEITSLPPAAERTDPVVLAMPGPQAQRLIAMAAAAEQIWSPVLTAVLTYPQRVWADFHAAFVNDHPVLASLCDDGDRRGDQAPVLVAHSTGAFARPRLGDPAAAADDLATAVAELLRINEKPQVYVHRWTFALPEPRAGLFAREGDVYLAGDAFGKPRVQTAWLSGRAVAHDILRRTTPRSTTKPQSTER
ncbi:MAG: renalase [Actinoplanes sp.]|nr:renalase [Actinoplanes sp.]